MNCVLPGATHRCVDILASVDWRKKTQLKSWEFCLTRWLSVDFKPRVALKGCSKEAGRKLSTRMTLVKQEHSTCNQTHISYERSLLATRNRPQIGGPSRFSRYEEMKESGSQNLLNYLTILKTCSACFPQSTEHPIPDLHAELPSGDVEGHLLQQLMI